MEDCWVNPSQNLENYIEKKSSVILEQIFTKV
jgi:hypothetical protein